MRLLPSARRGKALRAIMAFSAIVLAWQAGSMAHLLPAIILPSPLAVLTSMGNLLGSVVFWQDVAFSAWRIGGGFLLSTAISLPFGMLLGRMPFLDAYLGPVFSFIRYIPPSAFVPLSILWFGTGETQKMSIIVLGVAPYLTLLVADEASKVRQEYLDAAATLGAGRAPLYRTVILPAALPGIWDALRLMFGVTWTFLLMAEIVAAQRGLGHVVIQAQRFLRIDTVIAAMILIGLLGIAADRGFALVARTRFAWMERIR